MPRVVLKPLAGEKQKPTPYKPFVTQNRAWVSYSGAQESPESKWKKLTPFERWNLQWQPWSDPSVKPPTQNTSNTATESEPQYFSAGDLYRHLRGNCYENIAAMTNIRITDPYMDDWHFAYYIISILYERFGPMGLRDDAVKVNLGPSEEEAVYMGFQEVEDLMNCRPGDPLYKGEGSGSDGSGESETGRDSAIEIEEVKRMEERKPVVAEKVEQVDAAAFGRARDLMVWTSVCGQK